MDRVMSFARRRLEGLSAERAAAWLVAGMLLALLAIYVAPPRHPSGPTIELTPMVRDGAATPRSGA